MTMTNFFAKGFQFTSEALTAVSRLEKFFGLEEREIKNLSKDIPDPCIGALREPNIYIYIKDGYFSYGSDNKLEPSPNMVLKGINIKVSKGELLGGI